jgi:hypothetical protein
MHAAWTPACPAAEPISSRNIDDHAAVDALSPVCDSRTMDAVAQSHHGEPSSYAEGVAAVVEARRDEILADLTLARKLHDRAISDAKEAERQIAALEALMAYAKDADPAAETSNASNAKITLHAAMRQVLEAAPSRMMRAADIASEITRKSLYRMQDGRPVEPQQIHARVGHYPQDFAREGTFIRLA